MRPTTQAFPRGPGGALAAAVAATVATGVALAAAPPARAQAAIDPNVAPRAAALERGGERPVAIELLGRYLATAPDDGRAWLQLGRFYLLDARDWHLRGHRGDPDGRLYLDFAATALDQATRLEVDSGIVLRGVAEVERSRLALEGSGWEAYRAARPAADAPAMPGFVVELGVNLLGSCPAGGILLTGSDLEAVAVWYGGLAGPASGVIPLRPELYATDTLYRARLAAALGVSAELPVRGALADAAGRRPLCLAPGADSAAAPPLAWTAFRLVRVSRPGGTAAPAVSVAELLRALHAGGSVWPHHVRGVYAGAARHNPLLCSSLGPLFRDAPPPACRP